MGTAGGKASHVGHFVSWSGGCLLIGRAGRVVPVHAHYALQIAFGVIPGIRFRTGEQEPWTAYAGALIPSRHPHAMDATHVPPNAVLLIEPETREGRALAARFPGAGIAPLPEAEVADVAPALFAAWTAQRSADAVVDAAQQVVRALAGGVPPAVVSDERILRAVAFIQAHLDGPLALAAVASEACLSPSRFRHLFVAETGMALRPYILWRRMLRVWELLTAGRSLSAAAHAAGFADAAHLSRTSRAMFGFPPSTIQFAAPLPAPGRAATEPPTSTGPGRVTVAPPPPSRSVP